MGRWILARGTDRLKEHKENKGLRLNAVRRERPPTPRERPSDSPKSPRERPASSPPAPIGLPGISLLSPPRLPWTADKRPGCRDQERAPYRLSMSRLRAAWLSGRE